MFVDVGCGLRATDLRQADAPRIESLQCVGNGALRAPICFRLVSACLVGAFTIRVRLTHVLLVRNSLASVLLAGISLISILLIRIRLASVIRVRFRLIRVSSVDLRLADVLLARFFPDDVGVLGAWARLRAWSGLRYAIAGVRLVTMLRDITAIGLIPAATQFGHASVWPERTLVAVAGDSGESDETLVNALGSYDSMNVAFQRKASLSQVPSPQRTRVDGTWCGSSSASRPGRYLGSRRPHKTPDVPFRAWSAPARCSIEPAGTGSMLHRSGSGGGTAAGHG
jgi:hypothetical protein